MAFAEGNSGSFARRLKWTVALAATAILIVLAVLRGLDLWRHYLEAIDTAERRATNLSRLLAGQVRLSFESADAALRQIGTLSPRIGGTDGSPEAWRSLLGTSKAALTGVGSISVTDHTGIIRHSTLPGLIGQSRTDRFIFRQLLSNASAGLVADTPIRSQSNSSVILPLGRRLVDASGTFDGIVVVTYEPGALREFLRGVDVGSEGAVWAFHPDGFVLFQEPSTTNPIGASAQGNPLFDAARWRTEAGVLRGRLHPDGPVLVSAFQPILDPPIVVAASLSNDETLGGWWREVAISSGVLILLAAAFAALLAFLFHHIDARVNAELALARAQRLEAIGQLTGGVAHDFNNLLTVMLGNLYRLKIPGGQDPAVVMQAAEQIEGAARRAADLTRRLLAFARQQPLDAQTVDLNFLVHNLLPILGRLLGEDVMIKANLAPQSCRARIDTGQAETALINLVVNARDAMPKGGLLVIETASVTLDRDDVAQNPDLAPGRYAMIAVSDTGVGIAPQHLAHVFEPFFTTKEVGKGTGLGLSMAYGFVRQSGGDIRISSEIGQGTTVKLYFPESHEMAVALGPAEELANDGRGRGEIVLLVEDETAVRDLAVRCLTELGYKVTAAGDGPAALALAQDMPRIDLLFTDIVLPKGMNGNEIAKKLQDLRPGLKVLYTSGYADDLVNNQLEAGSGIRLLAKPYDRDDLARAIRAALDEQRQPADLLPRS